MDVYDRMRDGIEKFIKETDRRIQSIERNSHANSYDNIEKDLRRSSSQLLKLVRSNEPNNTSNEMSDQLRHQRAKESLEHCIELMYSNRILGNTFVADSDLLYALNIEKKFLENISSSKIDEKCLNLSYRLNELANYVLETNNINLLE